MISQCIEVLGKGCLTEQWMNDLVGLFEKNLSEHFMEQEAVIEKRKEEDYDEVICLFPLFRVICGFEKESGVTLMNVFTVRRG